MCKIQKFLDTLILQNMWNIYHQKSVTNSLIIDSILKTLHLCEFQLQRSQKGIEFLPQTQIF